MSMGYGPTWVIESAADGWNVMDNNWKVIARFDSPAEAYQFATDVWGNK